ncbi:MAG: hypothetical protein QMC37_03390 [Flavobacteriales bacterium]
MVICLSRAGGVGGGEYIHHGGGAGASGLGGGGDASGVGGGGDASGVEKYKVSCVVP